MLNRVGQNLVDYGLNGRIAVINNIVSRRANLLACDVNNRLPLPILCAPSDIHCLRKQNLPINLFGRTACRSRMVRLPSAFDLALVSSNVLSLLPRPALGRGRTTLPRQIGTTNNALSKLQRIFKLTALKRVPSSVTLLILDEGLW